MREILINWLHESLKMDTGEEMYIPADSKDHQKELYKAFRKELDVMRDIDPESAAKLRVGTAFKDLKFWVMIRKINATPLTAFKKGTDGVVKVTIPKSEVRRGSSY